jgi:methylthioribose-1-phosphate isomerase
VVAPEGVDPGRRAFFREFGKQAVSVVGQVAGMADVVSRSANAMAGGVLGLDDERTDAAITFIRPGQRTAPAVSAAAPAADGAFRSAYRLAGDELVVLDQRGLPDALDEVVARRGSDVAYYLRLGLARGGTLLAQLAAYGLALTAAERATFRAAERGHELRRTEQALLDARPSAHAVRWAVQRMREATTAPADAPGDDVAARARAEADAIAADLGAAQATIAATIAASLPQPSDRPLTVLLHGSCGALAGGLVGAVIPALAQTRDAGRAPRLFVTEGRPFMDGARLTAWELRQADLPHQLIPDAAVAWLLARESVDAVLLPAEWIAASGDVAAPLGSRGIAQLIASLPPGERPQRIVSAPEAARETDAGVAIPEDLRPGDEFAAYLAHVPLRAGDALVPATDVVPAAAIDLLITETGAHRSSLR